MTKKGLFLVKNVHKIISNKTQKGTSGAIFTPFIDMEFTDLDFA